MDPQFPSNESPKFYKHLIHESVDHGPKSQKLNKKSFRSLVIVGFVLVFSVVTLVSVQLVTRQKSLENSQAARTEGTSVLGTLQVLVTENQFKKQNTTKYFIQPSNARPIQIEPSIVGTSRPGDLVKLQSASYNLSSKTLTSATGGSGLSVVNPNLSAFPSVVGPNKIAVILVDFANLSSSVPTVAQANTHLTSELIPYFSQNSFNKLALTGQVFGRYTLPISATCDAYAISDQAVRAADASIDYRQYQFVMVVYPDNGCGMTGYGFVGVKNYYSGTGEGTVGLYTTGVAAGAFNIHVTSHELGHNMGANHANGYDCGSSAIGSSCTSLEYADPWEPMGRSAYHLGAEHKNTAEWFAPANTQIITQSGDYTLAPLENTSSGLQSIWVKRRDDSNFKPEWYVVENRIKTGYDTNLPNSAVLGGIIKFVPGSPLVNGSTHLIDSTPGSQSGENDFSDAGFGLNVPFTDSVSGITITPLTKTGNQLAVRVVVPPITAAPQVDIKANENDGPINVSAGSTVTLRWNSTNATSCTASGTGPGWTGSKPVAGTATSGAITAATVTFTITCTGPQGNQSNSVIVNTQNQPIVNLKVNNVDGPITVNSGVNVNLTWTSSNTLSCEATGSWQGARSLNNVAGESVNVTMESIFTLTCYGAAGAYAQDSVTVNVNPPVTVDLKVNNSNGPVTVPENSDITLSWTTTNATSCIAGGDWSGNKAFSNGTHTEVINGVSGDLRYEISCFDAGGNDASDFVDVASQNTPVTADLKVNDSNGPINIASGDSIVISWDSSNATSCTASGTGWNGTKAASGSDLVQNVTTSGFYQISCTGPTGTGNDTVSVNVLPRTTADLKVDGGNGPVTIQSGGSVNLSWTTTNATTCTASGATGWTGAKPVNSASPQTISNITTNSTYSITCTNSVSSSTDSVVVNITTPPAPTVSLKVNGGDGPVTIQSGGSVNLSWTTTNATSCTASGSSAWTGSKPVNSASPQTITNITANTTYTLTCSNGTTSASDSVNVTIATSALPTVDLKINNSDGPVSWTSIASLPKLDFTWTTSNATSCIAKSGLLSSWSGTKAMTGSQTMNYTGYDQLGDTYTLTCSNASGSKSDTVVFSVNRISFLMTLLSPASLPTTYTKGATYTFLYDISEPNGTDGIPTEGFNVQAYVSNATQALVGTNGSYVNGSWKVVLKMPSTAGTYTLSISGYCSVDTSYCATTYGRARSTKVTRTITVK